MASEFQPQLQGGAVQAPQGTVPNLDISGLSSGIGNILGNTMKGFDRQRQRGNLQDVVNLQDGLLAMHQEREKGALWEEDLQSRLAELQNSGIIGEEKVEEFGRISQQLEMLKDFRKQGLGNDTVFRMRRNALLREAQGNNPEIADEIRALFSHDMGSPVESGEFGAAAGGDVPSAQIMSRLRQRHGDSFTAEDYQQFMQEQTFLAEYELRSKQGMVTTANVGSQVGGLVNMLMGDWDHELNRALGPSGTLSIEAEQQLETGLVEAQRLARQELSNIINRDRQQGKIITNEQERSLLGMVDSEFESRRGIMQGKDLLTRSRALLEIRRTAIETQMPALMSSALGVGGGSNGGENMAMLLNILQNPRLTGMAAETSMPWMQHVDSNEMYRQIGETYNMLMNGFELSPGMQDIADKVSVSYLANIPFDYDPNPNMVRKGTETLRNRSGGIDPDPRDSGLPANIMDAVSVLNDPKFSENWVRGADTQRKNEMKVLSRNWVSTAMINATGNMMDGMQGSDSQSTISYNPEQRRFETTTELDMDARSFTRGMGGVLAGPGKRLQDSANLLNSLLDLSNNGNLQDIVPSHDQIVNNFLETQRTLEENMEVLREQEEIQREEAAERRRQRLESDRQHGPLPAASRRRVEAGG